MSPAIVLNMPIPFKTQIVGTTAGGIMSPARNKKWTMVSGLLFLRCKINPAIAQTKTKMTIETTVMNALLKKARTNI
ncbi:hypothetical protein D3C77_756670 [compost metagenome]